MHWSNRPISVSKSSLELSERRGRYPTKRMRDFSWMMFEMFATRQSKLPSHRFILARMDNPNISFPTQPLMLARCLMAPLGTKTAPNSEDPTPNLPATLVILTLTSSSEVSKDKDSSNPSPLTSPFNRHSMLCEIGSRIPSPLIPRGLLSSHPMFTIIL